jgi:hypothetical integral membrane protein (TIGR02206 family)
VEPRRFVLFGGDHLAALALTALASIVLAAVARRHRERPIGSWLRGTLAVLMLAGVASYVAAETVKGQVHPLEFLPLHLCDAAIFLGVFALLTRRPLACELLYFWAFGAGSLALLTPEVWYGFPDWRFVIFFLMHGLTIVAAAVLTFGFGCRPGPGAAWRAFGWTAAYAALVAVLNLALGANFLYLRAKPVTATLLDHFGPWPVYIFVSALIGLALFHLLGWPFRGAEGKRARPERLASPEPRA